MRSSNANDLTSVTDQISFLNSSGVAVLVFADLFLLGNCSPATSSSTHFNGSVFIRANIFLGLVRFARLVFPLPLQNLSFSGRTQTRHINQNGKIRLKIERYLSRKCIQKLFTCFCLENAPCSVLSGYNTLW